MKSKLQIHVPDRPRAMNKSRVPEALRGAGTFTLSAGTDTAELLLYGVIGWDECSAENIVPAIKAISASNITIAINSPGGDVFDATAIYNVLKQHPANVTVNIDGLAASAASVIAMAGDTVNIGKNAFMMIHRAMTLGMGTGDDLRQTADVMDKIDTAIAQTYADATGTPVGEVAVMMKAETWFTGPEALAAGFVDAVTGDDDENDDDQSSMKISATAKQLKAFAHAPSKLLAAAAMAQAPATPATPRTIGPRWFTDSTPAGTAEYWDNHPEVHNSWISKAIYVRAHEREKENNLSAGDAGPSAHADGKQPTSVDGVKALAKKEWESNFEACNEGFESEDVYVRVRVRESGIK